MFELEVIADNQSGLAGMISGLTQQLPFAYSVALNNTVNDAQAAVRAKLRGEFILRRPDFISRTIYIGPADRARKDRLSATVRINPERNFLAKFEEGEDKQARAGKSLAIPIMREQSPMLIIRKGDPLSLARLFQSIEKRKGRVFKGRRKKGESAPINFGRVWITHNSKGTFILERLRPGRGGNRVLYWFRQSVPIDERLHFVSTARDAALASWDNNFSAALDRAIATMRIP
jgi:hypothetical protein